MLSLSATKVNLNHVKNKVRKMQSALPKKLGALAVQYIHGNFDKQGFVDKGVEKWPKRKKSDKSAGNRALLVKSGRGRRSIRVLGTGSNYVKVGTTINYMAMHNRGGTIRHPGGTAYFFKNGKIHYISNKSAAGMKRKPPRTKPHNITIPRRQFMPTKRNPSRVLNALVKRRIMLEIKKLK